MLMPVFFIVTDTEYRVPGAIDVGIDCVTNAASLAGQSGVNDTVDDHAAAVVDVGSRIVFTFA